MRKLFLPMMVAGLLLSSCVKESGTFNDPTGRASVASSQMTAGIANGKLKGRTYSGPEVSFKKGKVSTLYEVDDMGHPLSLAISIDNAAWNSLDMPAPGKSDKDRPNTVLLQFHPKVDSRIFNHAELDWNPHGHEPAGVYDKPHFDFHFYNMSVADVDAIPTYETDPSKFDNAPDPDYLPEHYINPGGGVPKMGCHWVDTTSAEFTPQGFGQTFIFGTYDGKVTFWEPMITKAFMEAHSEFERSIPQPLKFAVSGYYPTILRLQRTDAGFLILLENFEYRDAH